MAQKISRRLDEIIDSLPLRNDTRILEIGCGSGAAAREISRRFENVFILAIDRSEKAINQALNVSRAEISSGNLTFRQESIESFELGPEEELFDIAFAIRVGALDGRHPEIEQKALKNIFRALKPGGRLFIDGGDPLREIGFEDSER